MHGFIISCLSNGAEQASDFLPGGNLMAARSIAALQDATWQRQMFLCTIAI